MDPQPGEPCMCRLVSEVVAATVRCRACATRRTPSKYILHVIFDPLWQCTHLTPDAWTTTTPLLRLLILQGLCYRNGPPATDTLHVLVDLKLLLQPHPPGPVRQEGPQLRQRRGGPRCAARPAQPAQAARHRLQARGGWVSHRAGAHISFFFLGVFGCFSMFCGPSSRVFGSILNAFLFLKDSIFDRFRGGWIHFRQGLTGEMSPTGLFSALR